MLQLQATHAFMCVCQNCENRARLASDEGDARLGTRMRKHFEMKIITIFIPFGHRAIRRLILRLIQLSLLGWLRERQKLTFASASSFVQNENNSDKARPTSMRPFR